MIIVNSYLVYSQVVNGFKKENNYYCWLAKEMIENKYSSSVARRLRSETAGMPISNETSPSLFNDHGQPISGVGVHLTPNKRSRKENTAHMVQKRCKICGKKTIMVCSLCEKEVFLCNTKTGRPCFSEHVAYVHDSSI